MAVDLGPHSCLYYVSRRAEYWERLPLLLFVLLYLYLLFVFALLKGYAEVGSDTEEGVHECMGNNALIRVTDKSPILQSIYRHLARAYQSMLMTVHLSFNTPPRFLRASTLLAP